MKKQSFEDKLAAAKAIGWLAGRAAAVAMIRAELETSECVDNGQVWVNCTNALLIKVAGIRPPEE